MSEFFIGSLCGVAIIILILLVSFLIPSNGHMPDKDPHTKDRRHE